jgi:hypothetical protein
MAQQNVGRDLTISFNVGGVTLADFGLYTDTHFQPQWTEVRTKPTNNGGIPEARSVFGGYDVTITFDRVNGAAEALIQFFEDNWIAGNPDVSVSLSATIRNADTTVDQIQYLDGIMYPTDGGSFKGTDVVPMTFKCFFKHRQTLSTTDSLLLGAGSLIFAQ